MFIDENPVFEILEVLKEKREKRCFKTKKRNVNVISCRIEGSAVFNCNKTNIKVNSGMFCTFRKKLNTRKKQSEKRLLRCI